jgi:hypothetical protein
MNPEAVDKMTDEQILTLLLCIRSLAQIPYPFPENSPNGSARAHPALAFALGQIAGIATKAIAEYEPPVEKAPP